MNRAVGAEKWVVERQAIFVGMYESLDCPLLTEHFRHSTMSMEHINGPSVFRVLALALLARLIMISFRPQRWAVAKVLGQKAQCRQTLQLSMSLEPANSIEDSVVVSTLLQLQADFPGLDTTRLELHFRAAAHVNRACTSSRESRCVRCVSACDSPP